MTGAGSGTWVGRLAIGLAIVLAGGAARTEETTRTSRTVVRGAYGTQSRTEEGGTLQQVRTLEGSPALIRVGRSQPVPAAGVVSTPTGPALATGTAFVESGVGFYVRPRLAGDTVTLELWAENTAGSAHGEVEGQSLRTTVAGRLGNWIEVGAALREAETRAHTLLGGARETSYESRRVSLRVEEVR